MNKSEILAYQENQIKLHNQMMAKQFRLNHSVEDLKAGCQFCYSTENFLLANSEFDSQLDDREKIPVYGHAEMQGRRATMEDNFDTLVFDNFYFYALFDGHGNRICSLKAGENLLKMLEAEIMEALKETNRRQINLTNLVQKTVLKLDHLLYHSLLVGVLWGLAFEKTRTS